MLVRTATARNVAGRVVCESRPTWLQKHRSGSEAPSCELCRAETGPTWNLPRHNTSKRHRSRKAHLEKNPATECADACIRPAWIASLSQPERALGVGRGGAVANATARPQPRPEGARRGGIAGPRMRSQAGARAWPATLVLPRRKPRRKRRRRMGAALAMTDATQGISKIKAE